MSDNPSPKPTGIRPKVIIIGFFGGLLALYAVYIISTLYERGVFTSTSTVPTSVPVVARGTLTPKTSEPTRALAGNTSVDPVVYYRNRAGPLITLWGNEMGEAADAIQRPGASVSQAVHKHTDEMKLARENIAQLDVPPSLATQHAELLDTLASCEKSVNDYADAVESFNESRKKIANVGINVCGRRLDAVRAAYNLAK